MSLTKWKSMFKTYVDFSMLLAMEVFLFLCLKDSVPFLALVLLVLFWYLRTKNRSFVGILVLFGILLIPRYGDAREMNIGKVIEVHPSYTVLKDGNKKILVYTEDQLLIDSEYEIADDFHELERTPGFFRFDFVTYCYNRGIQYSGSLVQNQSVKEHLSFCSLIQKKINAHEDDNLKLWCNRLLLNISDKENTLDSSLFEQGFSYSAILSCIDFILKFFIDKSHRKKILLGFNIVLMFLYHFPLLLVQSLIFRLLSFFELNNTKKQGLGMFLTLFLFPYAYNSISFLIPAIYRISRINPKHAKWKSWFGILCIQSIFYQKMNLLQTLWYPIIRHIIGFGWLLAFLNLLFPFLPFICIYDRISFLLNGISFFDLPGSILGFGLPLFIYLMFSFRKSKYCWIINLVILLGFQWIGLFHPFAEISFINVGQGDAILIRMPMNQGNILIDTGKPSQWNTLNTFLQAKGITNLESLIITHSDDDHSGNLEKVQQYYHPSQLVTSHFEKINISELTLLDLNTIENDDENESSIVCYFEMNDLNVLLMADADKTTEESILKKYGNLHADILKLSHHGSKTGSTDNFLNLVRPDLGIISCGAYSIYHHPSSETIQRLLSRHIPYVITREVGDVSILCIGPFNLFITSSFQFSIL